MTYPQYVTFHEEPYFLEGVLPTVGTLAPDFTLTRFFDGTQSCLTREDILSTGKPTLISVITSVDTPIGNIQAKTFDARLREHAGRANALLVSSDLPFTLNRYHKTERLQVLISGSDYYCDFGERYGVLLADTRILARAVFVLNAEGLVRYAEVVNEITNEPAYQASIDVLLSLL